MAQQVSRSAHATTDHDEIRKWVEARGGCPARVKGTGGQDDVGMIRIDFPGFSGKQSLEQISWEEFFEKFDERELALLISDDEPEGKQGRFNKLVSRKSLEERSEHSGSSHKSDRGSSGKGGGASRKS